MLFATDEIHEVGDNVSFPMPEDFGKEDKAIFDYCYDVKVLAATAARVENAVVKEIIR